MIRSSLRTICALSLGLLAPAAYAAPGHAHGAHDHGAHGHGTAAQEQMPWGIAGDARKVSRTITLSMTDDMRFRPDAIEVRQGETIRFVLRNDGKLLHELVLGTRATFEELYAKVLKSPDMHHEGAHMVHVDPGKAGELVWHFNRPGDFEYACLIPGHYPAGMKGRISVVADPHAGHGAAAHMAEGEVQKVDPATRRITLKHGDLPGLHMGPMTMAFHVADAAMLQAVKPGDRVRFAAERVEGILTITAIEAVR